MDRIILLLLLPTLRCFTDTCPSNCKCQQLSTENQSMICWSGFPLKLPRNTTFVRLQNINRNNISSELFEDPSWSSVTNLKIVDKENTDIPLQQFTPKAFQYLSNLERLKVSGPDFINVHNGSLDGLISLRSLDLSYTDVQLNFLMNALVGRYVVPRLEYLDFSNLKRMRRVRFTASVLQYVFQDKHLKVLNCSGVNFEYLDLKLFGKSFQYLEVFNMSNTAFVHLTGSNNFSLPINLQKLDISGAQIVSFPVFESDKIVSLGDQATAESMELLRNIKEFTVNHILLIRWVANGTHIRLLPNVTVTWRILKFESNGIIWANFTPVGADIFSSLEEVYLGHNGLRYISPNIMRQMTHLKKIDFQDNEFYVMSAFHDFASLFVKNEMLIDINLSKNRLKTVPIDLFHNNHRLKILDLSRNQLEYFHIETENLLQMSELNLSGNRFKYLDESAIFNFETLYMQQRGTLNSTFTLSLHDNPFVCTCEKVESVRFLSTTKIHITQILSLRCLTDSENLQINQNALEKTIYLCKRKTIIIISTTVSLSVFVSVVVLIVMFCIVRRRRHRYARLRRWIRQYRLQARGQENATAGREYLVFLCYSSDDVHFATHKVYEELRQNLERKLHVDRDLICIGDEHFTPGMSIAGNIAHLIEVSKVVLLLVSKAFCKSDWCKFETEVAQGDDKPVILMFKEHVPTREMPATLRMLYNKYARAFWKEDSDGQMVLVPKWERFCDTILEYAEANKARQQ